MDNFASPYEKLQYNLKREMRLNDIDMKCRENILKLVRDYIKTIKLPNDYEKKVDALIEYHTEKYRERIRAEDWDQVIRHRHFISAYKELKVQVKLDKGRLDENIWRL